MRRFRHKTVTSVEKAVTLHFVTTQTDAEEIRDCFPKVVVRITYSKLFFSMAKEAEVFIKLQVKGGQANPAPPIGPALGSKGVNIMEFCKRFNAATQDKIGQVCPVIISVYKDKSFDFVIKTAPAALQLLALAKVKLGSAQPNRIKVGKVTWEEVRSIAENKMPDLNCFTVESAMKMVAGTARSLGITIEGTSPFA